MIDDDENNDSVDELQSIDGNTGELDYEPSEPGDTNQSIKDDDQDGRRSQLDTITDDEGVIEEGEIDDLEDGELKDDDDTTIPRDRLKPPPSLLSSTYISTQQRAPSSTTSGSGPGFGLASSVRPEDVGICKFYLRSQCTWGSTCKFMHPQDRAPSSSQWRQGDAGSISNRNSASWSTSPPVGDVATIPRRTIPTSYTVPPTSSISPQQRLRAVSDQSLTSAGIGGLSKESDESAWERGLKQARELMKKANEKREREPDFEKKRLALAPSDDCDTHKSTSVYDDSDGEHDTAASVGKHRKSTTDYYSHHPIEQKRTTSDGASRRSSEDRRMDESAIRDHGSVRSSTTRNTSVLRNDYYRDNASTERRPAFDPGPQVLYPSRDRERQRARERERVNTTNNRSSIDDRSTTGNRHYYDRERTSSLRNTVDDTFNRGSTIGTDYYHNRDRRSISNNRRSSPDRPLPYDRPTYDDSRSNEIRDPWDRDHRRSGGTPAAAISGSTTIDKPHHHHHGSSSSSTLSSKRSRSKSIETYSSSHSSASPETRSKKRKHRDNKDDDIVSSTAAATVGDSPVPYRIPRLSARKSTTNDRMKKASAPMKRSRSPLTPTISRSPDIPSYAMENRSVTDEDVRAPIKITIRPKARINVNSIGSPPIVTDTISSSSSSSPSPEPPSYPPSVAKTVSKDETAQMIVLHEQISMTKKRTIDKEDTDDGGDDDSKNVNSNNRDSRREELLRQLKSVEDAIAKKRSKTTAV